jgi:hypothetical protein
MPIYGAGSRSASAIAASAEPKQREMLTHLRTLWVNLAGESPHLDGVAVEQQIAALARIHSDLTRGAIN